MSHPPNADTDSAEHSWTPLSKKPDAVAQTRWRSLSTNPIWQRGVCTRALASRTAQAATKDHSCTSTNAISKADTKRMSRNARPRSEPRKCAVWHQSLPSPSELCQIREPSPRESRFSFGPQRTGPEPWVGYSLDVPPELVAGAC